MGCVFGFQKGSDIRTVFWGINTLRIITPTEIVQQKVWTTVYNSFNTYMCATQAQHASIHKNALSCTLCPRRCVHPVKGCKVVLCLEPMEAYKTRTPAISDGWLCQVIYLISNCLLLLLHPAVLENWDNSVHDLHTHTVHTYTGEGGLLLHSIRKQGHNVLQTLCCAESQSWMYYRNDHKLFKLLLYCIYVPCDCTHM